MKFKLKLLALLATTVKLRGRLLFMAIILIGLTLIARDARSTRPMLARGAANDLLVAGAMEGDCDKIASALSQGASPDALSEIQDIPALSWAAMAGSERAVIRLIDAGADVNGSPACDLSPLNAVIIAGKPRITQLLIDHGAAVNRSFRNGSTPLIMAIRFQQDELIDILLSCGADPNLPETDGTTPLKAAAELARPDIRQRLFAAGAF